MANIGDTYIYSHPEGKGFGEHYKNDTLTAEMTELDLHDGDEVVVMEFDADTDWILIQWTDSTGIGRITTVDPAFFDDHFIPAS